MSEYVDPLPTYEKDVSIEESLRYLQLEKKALLQYLYDNTLKFSTESLKEVLINQNVLSKIATLVISLHQEIKSQNILINAHWDDIKTSTEEYPNNILFIKKCLPHTSKNFTRSGDPTLTLRELSCIKQELTNLQRSLNENIDNLLCITEESLYESSGFNVVIGGYEQVNCSLQTLQYIFNQHLNWAICCAYEELSFCKLRLKVALKVVHKYCKQEAAKIAVTMKKMSDKKPILMKQKLLYNLNLIKESSLKNKKSHEIFQDMFRKYEEANKTIEVKMKSLLGESL